MNLCIDLGQRIDIRRRRHGREKELIDTARQIHSAPAIEIEHIASSHVVEEQRAEAALEHARHLGRQARPHVTQVLRTRIHHVAQAIERARQLIRSLGASTRHQPHELNGQVIAHDLEHMHVVISRETRAHPTKLDNAQHLCTKKDRHGDKRLERRHVLDIQAHICSRIHVIKCSGCRPKVLVVARSRQNVKTTRA